MKKELNIRALRHSKKGKHQKIYKKIKGLELAQHEVSEWSEDDVNQLAKRFSELEIKMAAGGDVIVRSRKDSWRLCDEVNFIAMYHRNINIKGGKVVDSWHVQDVFEDLPFALASIIAHDNYKINGINMSSIEILEMSYC